METLRKQQMALDAERQRRDILRRTMLARAQGVNAAAGQGVSQGDSSVIGGGAQSLATGDASTLGVNQNAEIGTKYGNAYAAYDSARGTMGMGSAIGSWGSGLVANSGTISRVGATYGLWGGKSTNDPGGWGRAFGGAI
jgi:hypothetical protein